jgi:NADH:ubiquinone oxidoreductase subunit 4 (subunit M)
VTAYSSVSHLGFVGEFLVLAGTFNAGKDWQALGMAPMFSHPALLARLAATVVCTKCKSQLRPIALWASLWARG